MNYIIDTDYHKKKKKKIEIELNTFVLNTVNTINYKNSDPDELIIINTSLNYIEEFLQSITNGGTKYNVKKIITTDLVIVKYFINIEKMFFSLFPNCDTIQINLFSNDFVLISRIIDDLITIKNIEYKLNDNIYNYNSVIKYKYFYDSFFTGSLVNIKNIKIINNIDINKTNCIIEKNIIANIVIPNMIDDRNNFQLNYIKKHNVNKSNINIIYFEYFDAKKKIYFLKNIINIVNIDFIEDGL